MDGPGPGFSNYRNSGLLNNFLRKIKFLKTGTKVAACWRRDIACFRNLCLEVAWNLIFVASRTSISWNSAGFVRGSDRNPVLVSRSAMDPASVR